MFPDFLPQEVSSLENSESIFLSKNIKRHSIPTLLSQNANGPATIFEIATACVKLGTNSPPILLLHGFDSSILEFRRLIPLLAAQKETWAVDLLGSGFTERLPDITYNPQTIREHLYSFWQTLIERPVILVGISMGGATAIDFTITHPEAVQKLVLVNSVGFSGGFPLGTKLPDIAIALMVEFWRQRRIQGLFWGKNLGWLDFHTEDVIRCAALPSLMPNWTKALNDFTRSGGYYQLKERIREISKPTLILWGEKDDVIGTKDAEVFQKAIALSRLVWLQGLGHSPHWEKPELVARLILEFIDE